MVGWLLCEYVLLLISNFVGLMQSNAHPQGRARPRDVRLSMCDGRVYYPVAFLNVVAARTVLYPLAVVRTRLQIQNKGGYKGTFNALTTILKHEGAGGLYKGFIVNILHCVPYFLELTTVERVRQAVLRRREDAMLLASFSGGLVGGFCGQLLAVPLDVVSQHMMLVGQKMSAAAGAHQRLSQIDRIHVPSSVNRASGLSVARYLIGEIYRHEGPVGFYRGFSLSTLFVSYNAGLWWSFYYFYQGKLTPLLEDHMPTLAIQCLCGPLSSACSNFLANPIDVMRARKQISKTRLSNLEIFRDLWAQEGYRLFWKGLTARLTYTMSFSFLLVLGYESAKQLSLKDEYRLSSAVGLSSLV